MTRWTASKRHGTSSQPFFETLAVVQIVTMLLRIAILTIRSPKIIRPGNTSVDLVYAPKITAGGISVILRNFNAPDPRDCTDLGFQESK